MAANVNRWMKYAKARIDAALGQGNEELDRLEAEREAELADKPWLRSEGDAPTFDEARARIEWEAERQRRLAEERGPSEGSNRDAADRPTTGDTPTDDDPPEDDATATASRARPAPRSEQVEDGAEAAARESARIELEQRQQQSAARLDEIRRELGIASSEGDETDD